MRSTYEAGFNAVGPDPSREAFLEGIIPLARWWEDNGVEGEDGRVLHVPWQVTVVQAAHESTYGTERPYGPPDPAREQNITWKPPLDSNGEFESWNYFGMTAPERLSRWPAVADGTWEQKPTGEIYQTVRYFRAYPNPAASVAHYQQNLTYFAGIHEWAGEATDKAGIISMLGNIGRTYATDLEYGQKAERVFNDIFER